eukprot:7332268-Ditylum_brightwellii.AAC.1
MSRFVNHTKPTKLLLVLQEIAVSFALMLEHASSGYGFDNDVQSQSETPFDIRTPTRIPLNYSEYRLIALGRVAVDAVDLLGTYKNDFKSLGDISDGEIKADENVSTSIADQRKESDTIVDKWFLYKVHFSAAAKEQNPNFDEAVVSRKPKRLPDGTYSVVRMYKLK